MPRDHVRLLDFYTTEYERLRANITIALRQLHRAFHENVYTPEQEKSDLKRRARVLILDMAETVARLSNVQKLCPQDELVALQMQVQALQLELDNFKLEYMRIPVVIDDLEQDFEDRQRELFRSASDLQTDVDRAKAAEAQAVEAESIMKSFVDEFQKRFHAGAKLPFTGHYVPKIHLNSHRSSRSDRSKSAGSRRSMALSQSSLASPVSDRGSELEVAISPRSDGDSAGGQSARSAQSADSADKDAEKRTSGSFLPPIRHKATQEIPFLPY